MKDGDALEKKFPCFVYDVFLKEDCLSEIVVDSLYKAPKRLGNSEKCNLQVGCMIHPYQDFSFDEIHIDLHMYKDNPSLVSVSKKRKTQASWWERIRAVPQKLAGVIHAILFGKQRYMKVSSYDKERIALLIEYLPSRMWFAFYIGDSEVFCLRLTPYVKISGDNNLSFCVTLPKRFTIPASETFKVGLHVDHDFRHAVEENDDILIDAMLQIPGIRHIVAVDLEKDTV